MSTHIPLAPAGADDLRDLDLPGPRIWRLKELAAFFGFTMSWAYKIMSSEDPPPRCPGLRRPRFDTHSPAFQLWVARQLGYYTSSVDTPAIAKLETAQRKQDAGHHANGGNGDGP
jgi:hypothetical protein